MSAAGHHSKWSAPPQVVEDCIENQKRPHWVRHRDGPRSDAAALHRVCDHHRPAAVERGAEHGGLVADRDIAEAVHTLDEQIWQLHTKVKEGGKGSGAVNPALWIAQIPPAAVFLDSGVAKSALSKERLIAPGQTGVTPFPEAVVKLTAAAEVLAARGCSCRGSPGSCLCSPRPPP